MGALNWRPAIAAVLFGLSAPCAFALDDEAARESTEVSAKLEASDGVTSQQVETPIYFVPERNQLEIDLHWRAPQTSGTVVFNAGQLTPKEVDPKPGEPGEPGKKGWEFRHRAALKGDRTELKILFVDPKGSVRTAKMTWVLDPGNPYERLLAEVAQPVTLRRELRVGGVLGFLVGSESLTFAQSSSLQLVLPEAQGEYWQYRARHDRAKVFALGGRLHLGLLLGAGVGGVTIPFMAYWQGEWRNLKRIKGKAPIGVHVEVGFGHLSQATLGFSTTGTESAPTANSRTTWAFLAGAGPTVRFQAWDREFYLRLLLERSVFSTSSGAGLAGSNAAGIWGGALHARAPILKGRNDWEGRISILFRSIGLTGVTAGAWSILAGATYRIL